VAGKTKELGLWGIIELEENAAQGRRTLAFAE
jgi:hypothetical protein